MFKHVLLNITKLADGLHEMYSPFRLEKREFAAELTHPENKLSSSRDQ